MSEAQETNSSFELLDHFTRGDPFLDKFEGKCFDLFISEDSLLLSEYEILLWCELE